MRRCGLVLAVLALAVAACSKTPSAKVSGEPQGVSPPNGQSVGIELSDRPSGPMKPSIRREPTMPPEMTNRSGRGSALPTLSPEEELKYETAMTDALGLMADKKWTESLAAFESLERVKSTEQVRLAIDRLKRRIDLEGTAEQTTANIQAVLDDGKADEAATLAAEALEQFGASGSFERLLKLKRQADAVVAVQLKDRQARFDHFTREYAAAAKDDNRRAALVALEQALQHAQDDKLKAKYDELAGGLDRYDRLLARATELRREPDRLDEAIEALTEAKNIWDTLAVRQELDECQEALQSRRERLGVADFEVRGEVGLPEAGAFIADELLPAFRSRYALVERGQLNKVAEELKLKSGPADDDPGRREFGRAARLRYLVVGSITPVAGLTVDARLVDVQTGLIEQTARLVVRDAEDLTRRLPQLARDLMMTDDQKRAAEQERAAAAPPVEVLKPADDAALPPPPDAPAPDAPPPPPLIPADLQAPALGNLQPDQFDQLPGPPAAGETFTAPVIKAERDRDIRRRSLFVALELGDNLFRRGLFGQAFAHFEFALNLAPDRPEVRLRVERCRPLLPPPPPPAAVVRPRLAVLDFLVVGEARVVPPYLRSWTPEAIAPYFAPEFVAVPRGELFWWMGRLGITPADLLDDPAARQYLGRALNVRYFLFGNLVQTASFNVTTHLIDAEYGFLAGSARIHVRNPDELKVRLGELAWLSKLSPEQRRAVENENAQWALLINDIRRADADGRIPDVEMLCRKGLRLRPSSVELRVMLDNTERRKRRLDFDTARNLEFARQQQQLIEAQRRQLELARAAEQARVLAEQLDATAADRQRLLAQRQTAAEEMVRRAQFLVQAKRFSAAVQLYEGAAALRPDHDATYRELALARARAEETARANVAEEQARREAELRRKREAELAQVRASLDAERQRHAAEEAARRRVIDDRDRREAEQLLGLAQQLSAKQQYDQALAAAQKAKQLRPSPEADRLVSQLLIELARANAERRGEAAKADLERQLAAERQARAAAEADARKNRDRYESLLSEGRRALQQQKFDEAERQFLNARKVYDTDAVLTGLQQVKTERARADAQIAAQRRRQEDLQRQNEVLKAKLADAQSALATNQHDRAITLYKEAKKIAPTDTDVLAGLARAEQARDQGLAKARREGEDKTKRDTFQRLLSAGKASLAAKKYEAAALALGEALKMAPNDAEVKAALAQAETQLSADAQAKAERQKKAEQYQANIRDGRRFLAAGQYERALTAFRAAQILAPGDQAAADFVQQTKTQQAEADKARDADMQARQAAARKAGDLTKAIAQIRTALAAGKLDEARAAYSTAVKIDANHADVMKALADIRKAQSAAEAEEAKKNEAARVQKRMNYDRLMDQGRAALQAKKYAEAAKAFESALGLFPGDADAVKALAEAKKGPPPAPASPPMPVKPTLPAGKPAYTQQMQQGAGQEKAGKYDQALLAYRAALRAAPNDPDAQKKADYCQAMIDGDKAMKQRKFADARTAFETATKLFPDDANAKAALQRARTAK